MTVPIPELTVVGKLTQFIPSPLLQLSDVKWMAVFRACGEIVVGL